MENEENMFLSILRLARITTLHSDISADRLFELATFLIQKTTTFVMLCHVTGSTELTF